MKKNVVIIILLLAVIGSVGYIGYDKIYLEKNAPKEEKEPDQEEIPEEETINTSSTFVEDLIGRYDYYFISDMNLENMLYKGDNTNASSLTEDFIKQTATYAYYAIPRGLSTTWQQTYSFTSEDLQKQIRKLYGPEVTVTDGTFEMDCGTYDFNAENSTYTRNEGSGCGGTGTSYLTRKIMSAEKENEDLRIAVAIARVDMGNNQILNMNDQPITGLTTENFNINNVVEQLDQFTYQFKYDKENNNYYLNSITKTK